MCFDFVISESKLIVFFYFLSLYLPSYQRASHIIFRFFLLNIELNVKFQRKIKTWSPLACSWLFQVIQQQQIESFLTPFSQFRPLTLSNLLSPLKKNLRLSIGKKSFTFTFRGNLKNTTQIAEQWVEIRFISSGNLIFSSVIWYEYIPTHMPFFYYFKFRFSIFFFNSATFLESHMHTFERM